MITVSGLAKSYGARTLFRDVTFQLSDGRRIALVGGNGAGKTTLIEIVLGVIEADAGAVHRPKDQTIGYLPQEITEWGSGTVLDEVLAGKPEIQELEHRIEQLHGDIASTAGAEHERALAAFGEAQSRFESLGGYAVEAEAHRVLSGLGFAPQDAARPLAELSGGWRMRAALARLLLARPDVLLLDEPTNHLDTDSVTWLEDTLAAYAGAILFVSHDRDFIDAVAERVLEVSGGTATEYVGGFAEFVVAREERLANARAAAARQAKEVAHTERFIERFRYKATKSRQVQSRIKTLEKLERIEVPDHRSKVARFGFPPPRRSSRLVAELDDVTVGYDGVPVLQGVDLAVERGEKLALIGPNGAGKTTLLRLLLGELAPMAGTCTIGTNVDVAYFAQHQVEALDGQRTALQELQAVAGAAHRDRNLRTVLGSFGLSGEAADRKITALSGGEQTRLALAKAMLNPVNLLIMDEPTNHLDLPSCDVLEDALEAYPGTIVLVTHDRYLIRSVATSLVAVRNGRVELHRGVDEAVLSPHASGATPSATADPARSSRRGTAAGPASTSGERSTPSRVTARRTEAGRRQSRANATRELRQKAERLERDLARVEDLVADLQRQLADPDTYQAPERVKELVAAHDDAKDRAAVLMDQWLEAQGALDRAQARFA
jgi:ATP-binding cassette subfamily F protein 3